MRLCRNPARRGDDVIQHDVVGFTRNFSHDLKVECHANFPAAKTGQQPVVMSLAASEAMPASVKA